jgi:hypothetical protein
MVDSSTLLSPPHPVTLIYLLRLASSTMSKLSSNTTLLPSYHPICFYHPLSIIFVFIIFNPPAVSLPSSFVVVYSRRCLKRIVVLSRFSILKPLSSISTAASIVFVIDVLSSLSPLLCGSRRCRDLVTVYYYNGNDPEQESSPG